jgi:hypothetical protein
LLRSYKLISAGENEVYNEGLPGIFIMSGKDTPEPDTPQPPEGGVLKSLS